MVASVSRSIVASKGRDTAKRIEAVCTLQSLYLQRFSGCWCTMCSTVRKPRNLFGKLLLYPPELRGHQWLRYIIAYARRARRRNSDQRRADRVILAGQQCVGGAVRLPHVERRRDAPVLKPAANNRIIATGRHQIGEIVEIERRQRRFLFCLSILEPVSNPGRYQKRRFPLTVRSPRVLGMVDI